jgi:Zn-dependent alcohol dehydrogenase
VKAAVCHSFGQPLVLEDVDIEAPRSGEVLVSLAATAICHSDIHLLRGEWGGTLPVVAGHEAAGIVEAVGENVMRVKPGDRVVVSLLRSCGRCFYCTSGASHLCDGAFRLDAESPIRTRDGTPLHHGGLKTRAFAERTLVDQSQVVAIPSDIPLDRAALLGCGVITGAGAVMNTARVQRGESVVVIGAGGVGLNTIQSAVLCHAKPVVAVDRLDSKLELARLFGAAEVVNAAALEPKELARSIRKAVGGGADYVFVTVGVPEAVAQAQMLIRPGGTVVVVGMPPVKTTAALRMFDIVWSEQRIIGSRMGGTRLQVDVPRLVDLYRRGRLHLDELITGRYSLDQINPAIASMESGNAVRNVILFS